jgi:membrane protease YdiL (CAAX protease family)
LAALSSDRPGKVLDGMNDEFALEGLKCRREDGEVAELTQVSTDRKTIREMVARHPLVSFVILSYAISWTAWFSAYLVDLGAVNGFGIIAGAGPALAAMLVSALQKPESSGIPTGRRWQLFALIAILAFGVMAFRRMWIVEGLVTVTGRTVTAVAYPTIAPFLVDILAAVVIAFFLSGVYASRQGVRDLLHSLDPFSQPVRWYWWAIAVGFYPFIIFLGNALSAWLGFPEPAPHATGEWYWLALDALFTFLLVLLGGGGLEEPGWRGFALPLLQKRYSPLRSSLLLAVMWAFWHWPIFWLGYSDGGPLGVFFFLIGVSPLAILFTAVFNWTRGSLPIVILVHTSINVTPIFLPASALAPGLLMLLILGLAFWMWRSPQKFLLPQAEDN